VKVRRSGRRGWGLTAVEPMVRRRGADDTRHRPRADHGPRERVVEARAFYCGLLGLQEVEKPAALRGRGGFWLQVSDRQVHVGTEEGVARQATKAHVAYAVTDLAGWRARLAAAGVAILDGVPIPGYARFGFRGPFGNRVELIEATAVRGAPDRGREGGRDAARFHRCRLGAAVGTTWHRPHRHQTALRVVPPSATGGRDTPWQDQPAVSKRQPGRS
jgi:catechol 2,3-dioxygenase-like lactoylglutathione lyase family enzyme